MNRRDFLTKSGAAVSALWLAPLLTACDERVKRPNVLLILTDDQGWGDLSSHNNELIDTPHMDSIARNGVQLTRFIVSPVCAPTRAALLTGRYYLRTGSHGVTRNLEAMRLDEITVADIFKENGYRTGCFGKWHNGAHYPYHPNGRGFDEFFGFCGGVWNQYFDPPLERNGVEEPTKGFITDILTDEALAFIRKDTQEPWFCYLPYNAPHSPFILPDKYFNKHKERGLDNTLAAVYGLCENIDDNIGIILNTLAADGILEDTIVVFMTDNGPNGDRYNGRMKGSKGKVYDGGVRVPLFIQWTGTLPAGHSVNALSADIDILPTLLDLCGLQQEIPAKVDGKSLMPFLEKKQDRWPNRQVYTHRFRSEGRVFSHPGTVHSERYTLVINRANEPELYDIIKDPEQASDISSAFPELTQQLYDSYLEWFDDVTSAGFDYLPIPVGYPGYPRTRLFAHEGILEGELTYSAGAGYTHEWITNWKREDDTVHWELDVRQSGNYSVELHYTCPKENVGSTFLVDINGNEVQSQITLPHDPEVLPVHHRVPHNRYYTKIWAKHLAGELTLNPGIQSLKIRPLQVQNETFIDLKEVTLTLM